jgi:hypothetical protein
MWSSNNVALNGHAHGQGQPSVRSLRREQENEMLPSDINRVDRETLESILGTAEGLTLDFKEELLLSSREEKKELLADAVAFANSVGGHILIGVSERRENAERIGVATALPGVECNPDGTILRIENLLRDGIAPRITGLRTKAVQVATGRYVLVLQIPQSWMGPHMVALGNRAFTVEVAEGSTPWTSLRFAQCLPRPNRR